MSNKCEGKEKAASITKKTSKRKQLVKSSTLPFSSRQAQREMAKVKMLERIEKMKKGEGEINAIETSNTSSGDTAPAWSCLKAGI